MYFLSYDEPALALVGLHTPGRDADDFDRHLEALQRLHDDVRLAGGVGRFVVVAQEGARPPGPDERRRMAEIVENGSDVRFVLVTRSPLQRAIVTAVGWRLRERGRRATACATFEEACSWMAAQTGRESTVLRRLLAGVQTAALRTTVAG